MKLKFLIIVNGEYRNMTYSSNVVGGQDLLLRLATDSSVRSGYVLDRHEGRINPEWVLVWERQLDGTVTFFETGPIHL